MRRTRPAKGGHPPREGRGEPDPSCSPHIPAPKTALGGCRASVNSVDWMLWAHFIIKVVDDNSNYKEF